ncbi:MAG: hypothetical protein RBS40_13390 [Rhodocyclaceae bacterium]|nr:hypothetical protein [Rhodocyclaceae bacterium]
MVTDTVRIRRYPRPAPHLVRYERAVDLAASLPDLDEGEALFALVSGNFIFGDLIEALLVERNWYADSLLIATLSLGLENVDSLRNLQQGNYVGDLGLVVSDFWYAHERRAGGGVPYIEATLGTDPRFRFAAAGLHTKITCLRTSCGRSLVLHGSANLRSSRNLEQLMIERSEPLHDFNAAWINHLLAEFSANPKSLRGDKLWQTLPERPTTKAADLHGKLGKPQPASAKSAAANPNAKTNP